MPRVKPFKVVDETQYVSCPRCGKGRFAVSHLEVRAVTIWTCEEWECSYRFRVNVIAKDEIELTALEERCERAHVLLKLSKPVYVVVECFKGTDDDHRYHFEESTCPMNIINNIVTIKDEDGDEDRHGLFEYVREEQG